MRAALSVCLLVAAAGCAARVVDLGDGGPTGSSSGILASSTEQEIVTCTSPTDRAVTLGNGYSASRPTECSAPSGTRRPVSSVGDVVSSLVGLWYDCTSEAFGIPAIEGKDTAIELTSDGRYAAYASDSFSLVPFSSVLADDPSFDDGGSAPSSLGTYAVVDGAATYGPGTYVLQFHPAAGGLFEGQVFVTTAPVQLHFGDQQLFVPALPWSPRTGVCSCMNATEAPEYEDDATGLSSAIIGKWMWCGGMGSPPGNIGIEFAADSTWYGLNEDASGQVARSAAALQHGTFKIVPTPPDRKPIFGPEPLTLELNQGTQFMDAQLLYFPHPRVMEFSTGTYGQGGAIMNSYSICLPMP